MNPEASPFGPAADKPMLDAIYRDAIRILEQYEYPNPKPKENPVPVPGGSRVRSAQRIIEDVVNKTFSGLRGAAGGPLKVRLDYDRQRHTTQFSGVATIAVPFHLAVTDEVLQRADEVALAGMIRAEAERMADAIVREIIEKTRRKPVPYYPGKPTSDFDEFLKQLSKDRLFVTSDEARRMFDMQTSSTADPADPADPAAEEPIPAMPFDQEA